MMGDEEKLFFMMMNHDDADAIYNLNSEQWLSFNSILNSARMKERYCKIES